VTVRDAWQRVPLRHVYVRPIVVCGVNTRGSTTQAVTQIRRLEAASDGTWSFDVRASQRSCHFANPPATAEHMSYIVVEAGACAEGWQAGVLRVYDDQWHRVSLLHDFSRSVNASITQVPVVVSGPQTFDSRSQFITTRHHVSTTPVLDDAFSSFFLQVNGEAVWCQDGEFFAEYFDNIELAGSPLVTLCEQTAPNWHWHAISGGFPNAMRRKSSQRAAEVGLFSARWTTRLTVNSNVGATFSSHANRGSRIVLDVFQNV